MDESRIAEIIADDVELRLVEPQIYSVYPEGEAAHAYDENVAFYDRVIGNRTYNRIMWGYDSLEFIDFTQDALNSREDGWVLDAGCGSLVFTAKAYAEFNMRPVVFLDQSIEMLRAAKARLIALKGEIPVEWALIQGDVLGLPFKSQVFETAISLGVLHVLEQGERMVGELERVLTDVGSLYLTSLVTGRSWGDRYLKYLFNSGGVAGPREPQEAIRIFMDHDIQTTYAVKGNMIFISTEGSGIV